MSTSERLKIVFLLANSPCTLVHIILWGYMGSGMVAISQQYRHEHELYHEVYMAHFLALSIAPSPVVQLAFSLGHTECPFLTTMLLHQHSNV
jgi:hypothetical protein